MRPFLGLLLVAGFAGAQGIRPPENAQKLIQRLTVASFPGSPQDSIQALATDTNGNVLVAGTTYSAAFPVKNATQTAFAEATILKTTNLGATWTKAGHPPGGVTALALDPTAAAVMFATNSSGIYRSADAGQTWQLSYPGLASAIVINPGSHLQIAAVTTRSALVRSLDGGVTWSAGAACGCGNLLADPAGSGTLLSYSISTSAQISRDWGLTFQNIGPSGVFGVASAAAFDPSHAGWIYLDLSQGVMGNLFLSTDYGATWTKKASPPSTFSDIMGLEVDPSQPNRLVAAAPANGFYVSSDGASSWTLNSPSQTADPYFLPETVDPFALAPQACDPGGGIFALGSGPGTSSVAFSPDLGLTWMTPQLSQVSGVVAGPNCSFYVWRRPASDAFVAKIAASGAVLWATYLGGSDRDTAVALVVDAQDNAYIAGNTSSPDFPVTTPHIGPMGEESVFVTKFSPAGTIIYSATIGGEAANTADALAVDGSQSAYLLGYTDSFKFRVTPGTIVGSLSQGSYTGFLAKLSPAGLLSYATYLGQSYTSGSAILVDESGEPTVAGAGIVPGSTAPANSNYPLYVMKLDAAATQVLRYSYVTPAGSPFGITSMALDSQGSLIVFGQNGPAQATQGAYSSQQFLPCEASPYAEEGDGSGDAYVMKLGAANWQPAFTAVFTGTCGVQTGAIAIDSSDNILLALGATNGLQLSNPIVGAPPCQVVSSAVAKLSADGSTLEYSTFLPGCGVPGLTLMPDGTLYAGLAPIAPGSATSVIHFGTVQSTPILLNGIANAFSGDASGVTAGGLYSLAISGFSPSPSNLGASPVANLPTELNGVQVLFNGEAAPILAVAPGQIIVAAPLVLPGFEVRSDGVLSNGVSRPMVAIQVVYNGSGSNVVLMPAETIAPGLLTTAYPNLLPFTTYTNAPDASALNADGTVNSASNPAAAGSMVTLYVTGMGETMPLTSPGAVATAAVSPATAIYSSWEQSGPSSPAPALNVSTMAGLVSAIFAAQVPIPANIVSLQGTDLGNGVRQVQVSLLRGVPVSTIKLPISNIVSLYVK